ncbi:hypothetical protein [Bacillus cereus group sp. BfR-BA-01310]|uniref:hypothetical protein n=1 Tax=Bacillus cereus group sp. BfR-BA-01310 TaxID=2920287 RepID=UPI001F57BAC0|nr:hypothetical protein [Bacillus cereus group sp. BfR-BA-01310]
MPRINVSLSRFDYNRVSNASECKSISMSEYVRTATRDSLNGTGEENAINQFVEELNDIFKSLGLNIPMTLLESLRLVHIQKLNERRNGK